jgi:hypothetical protein
VKINLSKDKHIGIIFHPRSGSHVLRHYLNSVLGGLNLGELFNPGVLHHVVNFDKDNRFATASLSDKDGTRVELSDEDTTKQVYEYFKLLDDLDAINTKAVFGVSPRSYMGTHPKIVSEISIKDNIQFIQLCRADVLYAIISIMISAESGEWHNLSRMQKDRNVKKKIFDVRHVKQMLELYVEEQNEINTHFPNVPTLYYEQFQFNVANLNKLFSGIPSKLVSIPYGKFTGNHKDLVENLSEVEDIYEQFVNDNKEFFPQYFNKLPHVQIDKCQGRQPNSIK